MFMQQRPNNLAKEVTMVENFEQAGKKIFDLAQAGQGCGMIDEVRKLTYPDIAKAFNTAQTLEESRLRAKPKYPVTLFKANSSSGSANVEVTVIDLTRDSLQTKLFSYTNAFVGPETTSCLNLKPKRQSNPELPTGDIPM